MGGVGARGPGTDGGRGHVPKDGTVPSKGWFKRRPPSCPEAKLYVHEVRASRPRMVCAASWCDSRETQSLTTGTSFERLAVRCRRPEDTGKCRRRCSQWKQAVSRASRVNLSQWRSLRADLLTGGHDPSLHIKAAASANALVSLAGPVDSMSAGLFHLRPLHFASRTKR